MVQSLVCPITWSDYLRSSPQIRQQSLDDLPDALVVVVCSKLSNEAPHWHPSMILEANPAAAPSEPSAQYAEIPLHDRPPPGAQAML